jgi:valyl-tRNA synthetase
LQAKLAKPEFAENAPPEVVAKDTLRRTELLTEIGQLRAQTRRVSALRTQ